MASVGAVMSGNPGRRANSVALAGAAIDLLFSVALGALLLVGTHSETDAVPRPLVIFGLFAAPGIIGVLGALANKRSVLVGAALPLLPGAFLSWSGLTLAFAIPAMLMLIGAATAPPRSSGLFWLAGILLAAILGVLLTAAGVVSLIWLTANTCVQTVSPVGQSCSSSSITVEGVAVGGVLVLVAVGIAVVATVPHLRESRRD